MEEQKEMIRVSKGFNSRGVVLRPFAPSPKFYIMTKGGYAVISSAWLNRDPN